MHAEPTWTPERAEAALAIAVEQQAPAAAEQLLMLLLMAREGAPEGEADAWMERTRTAFLADIGAMGDRMAAHVGASAEQTTAFAQHFTDAMTARFAQLKAGTVQTGGRA